MPDLPEVRQCTDTASHLFGATAVWCDRLGRWGVMRPGITDPASLGGAWATDAEVTNWEALR
jgi:hypothetical protein